MLLLDERIKHLELSVCTTGAGHNSGTIETVALENKWEEHMREVDACIDDMYVFSGIIWFRLQMERVELAGNYIPEGQFRWFVYIFSYLKFVIGETVSNDESQMYGVHASKVRKKK